VFFQVNARTAVSVCQASGLALAAAAEHGCAVAEYTSNEVKQALVGYGSATKEQVQRMVASVLGLATPPSPPDVADALALAVCHLSTVPLRRAIEAATAAAHPAAASLRERSMK
jgi:crossover junction endodeoxyribonuclease RuvC